MSPWISRACLFRASVTRDTSSRICSASFTSGLSSTDSTIPSIMYAVAEDQDPKPDPKAAAPASPADDDDSFIQRLRRVLPPILDELLDLDDRDDKVPPKSAPSTLREKEESVRDQVARAVRELEEESRQKRQPEPTSSAPPPPQAEVKPWRHRFWGDS